MFLLIFHQHFLNDCCPESSGFLFKHVQTNQLFLCLYLWFILSLQFISSIWPRFIMNLTQRNEIWTGFCSGLKWLKIFLGQQFGHSKWSRHFIEMHCCQLKNVGHSKLIVAGNIAIYPQLHYYSQNVQLIIIMIQL